MNELRDDISNIGKKLVEANKQRLNQEKLIQFQQKNLRLVINHVQGTIKEITNNLHDLSGKSRREINKHVKNLMEIGKNVVEEETTSSTIETTTKLVNPVITAPIPSKEQEDEVENAFCDMSLEET